MRTVLSIDNARIAYYGSQPFTWWLRSPLTNWSDADKASSVLYDTGDCPVVSRDVTNDCAARPAFNLDLDSVLFTSAATDADGKSSGAGAGALTKIPDYTGSEWKLTLLDDSRKFAISGVTTNSGGDTIAFSYSNAQTGTNEYISAVDRGQR